MKKVLSLMLVVLLCLAFTACGEDDKAADANNTTNAAAADSALVGTWVGDGEKVVFNADGTGSIDGDLFDWTVTGNTLTVTEQSGGVGKLLFTYAVAGNNLTLTNEEGDSAVYTKEGASTESTTTTAPTESSPIQSPSLATPSITMPSQVVVNSVVGSWEDSEDMTWTFNADGSFSLSDGNESINGTYVVSGNAISMMVSGETVSGTYTVAGDTLTLINEEGEVQTLVKAGASAPVATTPTQAVTGGSDLIGIWVEDADGLVMTINADGTGAMDDDPITWSVSGSNLTLTDKASGETISVVYGTSGSTLTFFTADGIVMMTFTKQ